MTKDITAEHVLNDLRYLTLLARSFPTVADASTEIINLEAILNLPKGTEHFLSDIHGEHQAFNHVLKNASGAIKRKVNEIFSNTLRDFEKKELCTLIYYPEQKLELIRQREKDLDDWYLITLNQLVRVCRNVSSKYTRSKVRKALPKEFSYIIQELLHESSDEPNKSAYVDQIINTIISTGRANDFIIAMCNLIQRLTIDLLHIIGDIYDRGPGAHIIMDTLCNYHNFDIQWGNHDILWMGAAAGNAGSIANVIRMCMRYGNLATLEDGYGINLLPLATFAMEVYGDDPCELFIPRTNASDATFDDVPVRSIKGENPIKANGKLLVIDGGFSKAYHPETGIAGYTLVYHSRGFQLVQHEPFLSTDQAIKEGKDIRSTTIVVELNSHRQMVKDTDKGADLQQQIHDLEKLLYAFRNGFIKEKERYK